MAEVHIFFQHSHTINTAEALGNLRSSEETRQLFESYFSDGHGYFSSYYLFIWLECLSKMYNIFMLV